MDICFVTTAKTDEEAKELLKALGARSLTKGGNSHGKNFYEAQAAASRRSRPALTTAARSAVVPTLTCASTVSAVSASVSWLYKGEIPGVKKASW